MRRADCMSQVADKDELTSVASRAVDIVKENLGAEVLTLNHRCTDTVHHHSAITDTKLLFWQSPQEVAVGPKRWNEVVPNEVHFLRQGYTYGKVTQIYIVK